MLKECIGYLWGFLIIIIVESTPRPYSSSGPPALSLCALKDDPPWLVDLDLSQLYWPMCPLTEETSAARFKSLTPGSLGNGNYQY